MMAVFFFLYVNFESFRPCAKKNFISYDIILSIEKRYVGGYVGEGGNLPLLKAFTRIYLLSCIIYCFSGGNVCVNVCVCKCVWV